MKCLTTEDTENTERGADGASEHRWWSAAFGPLHRSTGWARWNWPAGSRTVKRRERRAPRQRISIPCLPWFNFFLLLFMTAKVSAAETPGLGVRDARLQTLVEETVAATLQEFAAKKLQSNQIAVTLVDVRDAKVLKHGSARGDVAIYPRAW